VLWTDDDFVIIDFEGEPARPLPQRRFKRNPLRDVASMIRSFSYASAAALMRGGVRAEDVPKLEPWARAWEDWIGSAYLGGFLRRIEGAGFVPEQPGVAVVLLEFYLLEKVIYEVRYELENRPAWIEIPLRGLLTLLGPAPNGA
jgi:maltose alpha-D-glucosyltransferase/alpha-amylase